MLFIMNSGSRFWPCLYFPWKTSCHQKIPACLSGNEDVGTQRRTFLMNWNWAILNIFWECHTSKKTFVFFKIKIILENCRAPLPDCNCYSPIIAVQSSKTVQEWLQMLQFNAQFRVYCCVGAWKSVPYLDYFEHLFSAWVLDVFQLCHIQTSNNREVRRRLVCLCFSNTFLDQEH